MAFRPDNTSPRPAGRLRRGLPVWALVLLINAPPVMAQIDTDSLRAARMREVEAERARITSAGNIFLDPQQPEAARLAATEGIGTFVDPEQARAAARLALDPRQPEAIRLRALRLGVNVVHADSAIGMRFLQMVGDDRTPVALRREGVGIIEAMTWASPLKRTNLADMLEALRSAARSADQSLREEALGTLVLYNDSAAIETLRASLQQPSGAVAPARAARLLGSVDPTPYYRDLHRVLVDPPDPETRLQAAALLGGYPPSRAVLVRILGNNQDPLDLRLTALGAIAANIPDSLPGLLAALMESEATPVELRLSGIRRVELQRTTRDPKVIAAHRGDAFDSAMERLAQRSQHPEVRAAAVRYLSRTREPQ